MSPSAWRDAPEDPNHGSEARGKGEDDSRVNCQDGVLNASSKLARRSPHLLRRRHPSRPSANSLLAFPALISANCLRINLLINV